MLTAAAGKVFHQAEVANGRTLWFIGRHGSKFGVMPTRERITHPLGEPTRVNSSYGACLQFLQFPANENANEFQSGGAGLEIHLLKHVWMEIAIGREQLTGCAPYPPAARDSQEESASSR